MYSAHRDHERGYGEGRRASGDSGWQHQICLTYPTTKLFAYSTSPFSNLANFFTNKELLLMNLKYRIVGMSLSSRCHKYVQDYLLARRDTHKQGKLESILPTDSIQTGKLEIGGRFTSNYFVFDLNFSLTCFSKRFSRAEMLVNKHQNKVVTDF